MTKLVWLLVGLGCSVLACESSNGVDGDTLQEGGRADDVSLAGAGGDGEGAQCSLLQDEQGEPHTVRLVNETANPLYLGDETTGCTSSLGWRFELRDADGRPLADVGNCGTCRDATVTGVGGCPTICLTQPALTLQPGEHADFPWDGLFGTRVALPETCALPGASAPNGECRKATRPTAGKYTFKARAGAALACGDECKPCIARDGGGCETSNALVDSLNREATTEVELDGGPGYGITEPISIVFRD
jgi:hypothetical protein